MYSVLGHLYVGEKSVHSFTVFQLFQNLGCVRNNKLALSIYTFVGSAGGFYYAMLLPMHGDSGTYAQIWVQGSLLLVSTIGFVIADMRTTNKPRE